MAKIVVTICDGCLEESKQAVSLDLPAGALDFCPDCVGWALTRVLERQAASGCPADMGWLVEEAKSRAGA